MTRVLARSSALALGMFCLTNAVLGLVQPDWDANGWWVDLRALPSGVVRVLLLLAGMTLAAFACAPEASRWRRRGTMLVSAVLAMVCGINAAWCVWLDAGDRIAMVCPVPFSLVVAAALAAIAWRVVLPGKPTRSEWVTVPCGAAVIAGAATVLLMLQFGKTDYRREADAIVVFGARTYADGRPSDALADRVRTAVDLHHAGLAPTLVMSGGPGDGDIHETVAMRDFAIALGVPSDVILLDRGGVSTDATIRNTHDLFASRGIRSALAVSHFYHLPRVKMGYERVGVRIFTVPARESYTLTRMPVFMLREVAAFWLYYVRPPVA